MYNYSPYISRKTKSSFSIFTLFYYLIIIIVMCVIIFYLRYYYYVYRDTVKKNNEKFIDDNYSKELCDSFTSSSILDENKPENGGVLCLINYIKKFGTETENDIIELNYNNSIFPRYRLDNKSKKISFFDQNGILLNNKFCLFINDDKYGCILN